MYSFVLHQIRIETEENTNTTSGDMKIHQIETNIKQLNDKVLPHREMDEIEGGRCRKQTTPCSQEIKTQVRLKMGEEIII